MKKKSVNDKVLKKNIEKMIKKGYTSFDLGSITNKRVRQYYIEILKDTNTLRGLDRIFPNRATIHIYKSPLGGLQLKYKKKTIKKLK